MLIVLLGVGVFLFRFGFGFSPRKKRFSFVIVKKTVKRIIYDMCDGSFLRHHPSHTQEKAATHNTTATTNIFPSIYDVDIHHPPLSLSPSQTHISSKNRTSVLQYTFHTLSHAGVKMESSLSLLKLIFIHIDHVSQSAGNARISSSTDFKL